MSINIPNAVANLCEPIVITIRYDKLGKNQQTQLARFVETRVFVRRGIVPWLGKSLYDRVFGERNIGWVHIDNWRLRLHHLDHDDQRKLADALEETYMVGTLDDESQAWSERQRSRYSWLAEENTQPSGFQNLERLIANLRLGALRGDQHVNMSDHMSGYMQKDFTKRLINPKKNTSVLPPNDYAKELANQLRDKKITTFTCLAGEFF